MLGSQDLGRTVLQQLCTEEEWGQLVVAVVATGVVFGSLLGRLKETLWVVLPPSNESASTEERPLD